MESRVHLLYHSQMIRNQKGFSLIEILVVVALAAVVILGNSMFMSDFTKRMDHYAKESAEESELAVLNTMALNILKKSSLSFNRLGLRDDANLNFFDFYPDMPYSSFTTGTETRTFTLDTLAENFYILSSDEGKFSSTVFDPVHAYTAISPSPVDALADGTMTYRTLNSVPDFTNASGTKATQKLMSQIFGVRWANGKVFVVTCPTYLRPVASSGSVTLTTAPRMPTFVGKVSGDDLVLLPASDAGVTFNNTHPVTGATYGTLDDYFRSLPTVGGAAPFVKVEPAIMSRFELRSNITYGAGFYDLYMRNLTASGYAEDVQVALKIKKVTFKRKSITLPIISMEIQK